MTEPVTPIDVAHTYVAASLPCRRCGYELYGLSAAGRCPECGTAVWTTIVWRARTTLLRTPVDVPPTARQCRSAVLLALLALGWIAVCAVLGAVVAA